MCRPPVSDSPKRQPPTFNRALEGLTRAREAYGRGQGERAHLVPGAAGGAKAPGGLAAGQDPGARGGEGADDTESQGHEGQDRGYRETLRDRDTHKAAGTMD
jgi:hypothetical protein